MYHVFFHLILKMSNNSDFCLNCEFFHFWRTCFTGVSTISLYPPPKKKKKFFFIYIKNHEGYNFKITNIFMTFFLPMILSLIIQVPHPSLGSTHIKKSLNLGIAKLGPLGALSPWMSIDVPDVNTMFAQRKSNELQENHTKYGCSNNSGRSLRCPIF